MQISSLPHPRNFLKLDTYIYTVNTSTIFSADNVTLHFLLLLCLLFCFPFLDHLHSLPVPVYLSRFGSGYVPEVCKRGHCHCGLRRTALAPRSSVDCGAQPASPDLNEAGNSSRYHFTAWQTGTARTPHVYPYPAVWISATCSEHPIVSL